MYIRDILAINSSIDPFMYLATTFFLGILFSGVNNNLAFIFIFFIIYGIFLYYLCSVYNVIFYVGMQLALFCAYFLGWLIGRNISDPNEDPTHSLHDFSNNLRNLFK